MIYQTKPILDNLFILVCVIANTPKIATNIITPVKMYI